MREVAIHGDDCGVDHARQEGRGAMSVREVQEEVRSERQDYQLGWRGDTVNRKTAQPLLQVVSLGAEYKVFVAEERNGNGDRLGADLCDVGNQRLAAMRKEVAVKNDKERVKRKRENRIEYADEQETDDLARRQPAAKTREEALGLGIGPVAGNRRADWGGGVHCSDSSWCG